MSVVRTSSGSLHGGLFLLVVTCNCSDAARNREPFSRGSSRAASLRLTRGSSWVLEIALGGVPAKDQPHELFSSAEDASKRRVT